MAHLDAHAYLDNTARDLVAQGFAAADPQIAPPVLTARKRLGAHTRDQAVAIAVRNKLI